MPRILLAALFAFAVPAFAAGNGVDKVNGSINIETGQSAGNLTTVNGSIRLADRAQAGKLETVNGSIEIGNGGAAASAQTVNGHIALDAGARIAQSVETVNGAITLRPGADVGGRASNVNGSFRLETAHIGGGIGTVNGDIDIGANSRVEGGILVDKPSGWFSSFNRKPRIVIGPHAVVQGKLEFRRPVDLYVSDSATIGEVVGATPVKFSGDQPPN